MPLALLADTLSGQGGEWNSCQTSSQEHGGLMPDAWVPLTSAP